jgi:CheY-like chemotaxis protein
VDGMTSTRAIRQHEADNKLPRCRIVALTGLASASARLEALSSGVDHFMTKPLDFKALGSLLKKEEERKSRERTNREGKASLEESKTEEQSGDTAEGSQGKTDLEIKKEAANMEPQQTSAKDDSQQVAKDTRSRSDTAHVNLELHEKDESQQVVEEPEPAHPTESSDPQPEAKQHDAQEVPTESTSHHTAEDSGEKTRSEPSGGNKPHEDSGDKQRSELPQSENDDGKQLHIA